MALARRGARCSLPIAEAVDDADHDFGSHRLGGVHQVVVLAKRGVRLRAELLLPALKLDVPEATIFAEKGFRELWQGNAFPIHRVPEGR